MAKVASRTRVSAPVKKIPQVQQAPAPVDRQSLLTLSEDEGHQVYEARCMLQLLEEMALFAEREITVSRASLTVMMAVISDKLAFTNRFLPVDDEDIFEDQE